MQTKKQSLIEVITNVSIGVVISYFISTFLIPYYTGVELHPVQYGAMTMIYTTVSVIRGYLLRRFWNKVHAKQNGII